MEAFGKLREATVNIYPGL